MEFDNAMYDRYIASWKFEDADIVDINGILPRQ